MTATTAQISVEEYLRTCELQNRNLGEWDHATVQANLTAYLVTHRREWNVRTKTDLRVRVTPTRIRIPDICVLLPPAPYEPVLTVPPFLCIEVLSPSDNLTRVQKRIADFLNFGVPYVWLIHTETRQARVHTSEGATEVQDGVLRAAHIEVPLYKIFE
jgi:Uma2 family endonuclease